MINWKKWTLTSLVVVGAPLLATCASEADQTQRNPSQQQKQGKLSA